MRGAAVEASLVAAYRDDSATTEIYRLRIHPGRLQTSPGHGPGVIEHLFVTSGIVSVGPLGSATEVPAGSDVSWESATPHSYAAVGHEIAEPC